MKKLKDLLSNPTMRHLAHLILITVLIKKGVITTEQAAVLPPLAAQSGLAEQVDGG